MNKNFKRGAVIAATAATVLSLAMAGPSFASDNKSQGSTNGAEAKSSQVNTSIAVTITSVPKAVTSAANAARGAKFVAYALAADAIALPANQPNKSGKPLKVTPGTFVAGTDLTPGSLVGKISLKVSRTAGTSKFALYNQAGVGSLVTVVVDSAGVATPSATPALTAIYVSPTEPSNGEGKNVKGDRGERKGTYAVDGIKATVNLPADGKNYAIRVTELADNGQALANPEVKTGKTLTSSGVVTLRLGANDTYKIELVATDGTIKSTVTVTVAADGTVAAPIVLG